MPATAIGSAAHIKIKPKTPLHSRDERLRELVKTSGPNKNDQAIALITALIGDGVNTQTDIIRFGSHYGFKTSHVAMILKTRTGSRPEGFYWQRDANGRYSLLA